MSLPEVLRPYQKDFTYSYCLGPYPSFRLLELKPELCHGVIVSDSFHELAKITALCQALGLPCTTARRTLERLSKQKNCHMAAVFSKQVAPAQEELPHLVLEAVDDMGNLGTIMRSMAAFAVHDLILIGQCCDFWDPRCVRASMGAIFTQRVALFPDLSSYLAAYPQRQLLALYPDPSHPALRTVLVELATQSRLSLALGNEGRGLSAAFSTTATRSVTIPQSTLVDSLNLAEAATIALYELSQLLGRA